MYNNRSGRKNKEKIMAEDINVCTFVGRAVRDADIRKSNSGMTICKFSLALNGYKEGDVSFLDFVMFDKFAEAVGKFITKGNRIAVTSEADQHPWTDSKGNKRSSVEFKVSKLNLLDGGSDTRRVEAAFESSDDDFEDDKPF